MVRRWVGSGTQAIFQASDRFRTASGTQSGVNLGGAKFSYRPEREIQSRLQLVLPLESKSASDPLLTGIEK